MANEAQVDEIISILPHLGRDFVRQAVEENGGVQEALAFLLALQEENNCATTPSRQLELDEALARAVQAAEYGEDRGDAGSNAAWASPADFFSSVSTSMTDWMSSMSRSLSSNWSYLTSCTANIASGRLPSLTDIALSSQANSPRAGGEPTEEAVTPRGGPYSPREKAQDEEGVVLQKSSTAVHVRHRNAKKGA